LITGAILEKLCCNGNNYLYSCCVSVKATLQDRLKEMRPSEAEVTRRLLRNLGAVARQSLREVAADCRTSDTTVMRACRAAGFDGFQDLKYHVLRELTGGVLQEAPASQADYHDDLRASLGAAEAAVEAAARLIRGAQRVALTGVGASHGVALIATDILFTLGKQALPIQSEQMASFALTPPVSGLVVLAISHSGETQFPLQVVRQAREAGVKCIGLTNEPASELARAVDVLLPTQAVEPPRGSYAIAPRICQLAVLDVLFNRVGHHSK
jgi:RpiR family transcriptional regulator, carbohydrate utilization regulator